MALVSGPKPQVPRLQNLVPESVGAQACERMLQHLSAVTSAFRPSIPIEWPSVPPADLAASTTIGRETAELTRWAQTGEGELPDILDLFLGLFSRLHAAPVDRSYYVPPLDEIDIQPDDDLTVMLAGAVARLNLRMGQEVDVRGLAVLAGISYNRMRHLMITRSKRGRVTADEAGRFLEARGVPA